MANTIDNTTARNNRYTTISTLSKIRDRLNMSYISDELVLAAHHVLAYNIVHNMDRDAEPLGIDIWLYSEEVEPECCLGDIWERPLTSSHFEVRFTSVENNEHLRRLGSICMCDYQLLSDLDLDSPELESFLRPYAYADEAEFYAYCNDSKYFDNEDDVLHYVKIEEALEDSDDIYVLRHTVGRAILENLRKQLVKIIDQLCSFDAQ